MTEGYRAFIGDSHRDRPLPSGFITIGAPRSAPQARGQRRRLTAAHPLDGFVATLKE